MKIEIFSDLACPWCYIAKIRLEQALAAFDHGDAVEIDWKSFELAPDMPAISPLTTIAHLGHKGVPAHQAQAMIDNCTKIAAGDGLIFRFDKLRLFNTNKAHQVLHYAKTVGLQNRLKGRLFHAAFTEGQELGLDKVLIALAGEVGMDEAAVKAALESRTFGQAVLDDERHARELDVSSVPYFIINDRYALSGLQTVEGYLDALDTVWREDYPAPAQVGGQAAAACGPDACAN
jgi:predicted DsbA family dithiol-disulfide isomerase